MKQLKIFNTLTRKKENFVPLNEGFVGFYVCGPTVYGDPHLGHAKSYLSFDVAVRYLRHIGYRVRYVQNITDVGHLTDDADEGEDKLARQSRLERLEPMEIAEKYTYRYFRDMDKLKILRPDISPRASGHIPEQIKMIEKLIEEGHAYETRGNVYFDINSHPGYGKLSGRTLEEAASGVRVEATPDKRHPADFALWKKADPSHLMRWDSPWGEGFPGWHIECSAMAVKYLGETIDIHGGGLENQFPHHECEIAQCEGAHKKPFVRYWMHNNMVTLNGKKMGKSLGNAISLDDFFSGNHPLLHRPWPPEIIRFFLLQSHYRSTTDFSETALESAENGYHNLKEILDLLHHFSKEADESATGQPVHGESGTFNVQGLKEGLHACMNDDFNTAKAIGMLFEHLRPLKSQLQQNRTPANIKEVAKTILSFCTDVLAIYHPEDAGKTIGSEKSDSAFEGLMQLILDLRQQARKEKNWQTADRIRDRLQALNITIEDGPEGSTYKLN